MYKLAKWQVYRWLSVQLRLRRQSFSICSLSINTGIEGLAMGKYIVRLVQISFQWLLHVEQRVAFTLTFVQINLRQ